MPDLSTHLAELIRSAGRPKAVMAIVATICATAGLIGVLAPDAWLDDGPVAVARLRFVARCALLAGLLGVVGLTAYAAVGWQEELRRGSREREETVAVVRRLAARPRAILEGFRVTRGRPDRLCVRDPDVAALIAERLLAYSSGEVPCFPDYATGLRLADGVLVVLDLLAKPRA